MNEVLVKRKALAQIMERYLEGIIEKDVRKIPISDSCKITFNGMICALGNNMLWHNTLTIQKRQSFFDVETGGIVFYGITSNEVFERMEHFPLEDTSHFISYAVIIRLKVIDEMITEIEELAWSGRYRYFYCLPQDICLPDPFFETSVPSEEKMTRDELIEVVELYWEGAFGQRGPDEIPIHPDAQRYENGYLVSNHSYSLRGDFKWNPPLINSGEDRRITVPPEYRSYPIVDPARGIVVSMVSMIPRFNTTFILRIAEAFLVREGCIKRIMAFYPRIDNDGGWKN